MKGKALVTVAFVCAVVIVLFLRRRDTEPTPEPSTMPANAARTHGEREQIMREHFGVKADSVQVPPEVLVEVNRLIAAANPLGVEHSLEAKDFTGRVDYPKGAVVFGTKTHTIEMTGNQLRLFVADRDTSNPIAEPEAKQEAMRQWYKATAKWSKEEALAETERIITRLGIQTRWETREVEATELTLKNPLGEPVKVTPFYIVNLSTSNATLRAEFRMGESGPGRLTEWYMWPPMTAGK